MRPAIIRVRPVRRSTHEDLRPPDEWAWREWVDPYAPHQDADRHDGDKPGHRVGPSLPAVSGQKIWQADNEAGECCFSGWSAGDDLLFPFKYKCHLPGGRELR